MKDIESRLAESYCGHERILADWTVQVLSRLLFAKAEKLTPDNQRIIDAMIRGVWECRKCESWQSFQSGGGACMTGSCACRMWQERKEVGDG